MGHIRVRGLVDVMSAPRGWWWCTGEGRSAVFVSRYPGKATRWWRCPECQWVGFETRTDRVPVIGPHLAVAVSS